MYNYNSFGIHSSSCRTSVCKQIPHIIHSPCLFQATILYVKIKRNVPGAHINQLLILCVQAAATHTSGILGMLQITLNTFEAETGAGAGVGTVARNFLY